MLPRMNSYKPQYYIHKGYLPHILTDRKRLATVDRYRTRIFETYTNETYLTISDRPKFGSVPVLAEI